MQFPCRAGGRDDQNEELPVFIDRNGDRFQYVLDYMRDGKKLSLPVTISKEAFLNDLKYYGFENVDANNVTGDSSLLAYAAMEKKIDKLEAGLCMRKQREHNTDMLAHYCFFRAMYSGTLKFDVGMGHSRRLFFDRPEVEKYDEYDVKKIEKNRSIHGVW